MSDLPDDLDLKFLPDWLKEAPVANRYADFQGEPERRGGDWGDRGPSRGGPGARPGGRGPGKDRRDRPGGGPPSRGGRPGENRGGAPGKGPRPSDRGRDDRGPSRPPRPEPFRPAALQVEFIPEPNALAAIARQIRQGYRAYPLFGTARLFLDRPERYRVRLTATEAGVTLYQLADGPIAFDRATVESGAFRQLRAEYFREETVQNDPPKGNYTNVARVRSTGTFLGPTNHHGYQPAMRKIFEERFSRRMSFPQFQQQEIEIVSGEQAVNDWKEQARTVTSYVTTQEGAEPLTFKTLADAEQHFRKTFLPNLIKTGTRLEMSGQASHETADRSIYAALRDSWERERGFPWSLVNHIRPAFVEAGLHFFKHRKRVIYTSPIRPQRHITTQPMSDSLAEILSVIEAAPRCTRHDLAVKILGENVDAPELVERKTALAGDLRYLVHAGHVIEFQDATLDLPLAPKALEAEPEAGNEPAPSRPNAPRNEGAQRSALAGAQAASPATNAESAAIEQPVTESAPPAPEEPALPPSAEAQVTELERSTTPVDSGAASEEPHVRLPEAAVEVPLASAGTVTGPPLPEWVGGRAEPAESEVTALPPEPTETAPINPPAEHDSEPLGEAPKVVAPDGAPVPLEKSSGTP